jgi:hypothetical protein
MALVVAVKIIYRDHFRKSGFPLSFPINMHQFEPVLLDFKTILMDEVLLYFYTIQQLLDSHIWPELRPEVPQSDVEKYTD